MSFVDLSLRQHRTKTACRLSASSACINYALHIGGKIADVGTTLTTHVTVPIVAAGTAAVKTAADFDAAMSKVAAVSGAAGDELDALRDKAREMGAKTKFSA